MALKRRKWLVWVFLLAIILFLLGRAIPAHASIKHPCYQARIQFLNYPPAPSTFAHWLFYTGTNKHLRVLAEGEFSFQPNAGGGYTRVVSVCFTRNAYKPGLKISVETAPLNVACLDCQIVIQVRRVS